MNEFDDCEYKLTHYSAYKKETTSAAYWHRMGLFIVINGQIILINMKPEKEEMRIQTVLERKSIRLVTGIEVNEDGNYLLVKSELYNTLCLWQWHCERDHCQLIRGWSSGRSSEGGSYSATFISNHLVALLLGYDIYLYNLDTHTQIREISQSKVQSIAIRNSKVAFRSESGELVLCELKHEYCDYLWPRKGEKESKDGAIAISHGDYRSILMRIFFECTRNMDDIISIIINYLSDGYDD